MNWRKGALGANQLPLVPVPCKKSVGQNQVTGWPSMTGIESGTETCWLLPTNWTGPYYVGILILTLKIAFDITQAPFWPIGLSSKKKRSADSFSEKGEKLALIPELKP